MHRLRALVASFSVLAGLTAAPPAVAQDMYPGQEVTVNPSVGSSVLLYPGGKYGRVVHPLLQPGQPYPGTTEAPIHLHMPYHHVARAVHRESPHAEPTAVATAEPAAPAPAPASAPAPDLTAEPELPAAIAPAAAPVQHVTRPRPAAAMPASMTKSPPSAARVAAQGGSGSHASSAGAANLPFAVAPSAPIPTPSRGEKPRSQPVRAVAAPPPFAPADSSGAGIPFSLAPGSDLAPASPRIAKAEPPPRQTTQPAHNVASDTPTGMTKQSQIIFATGVADPAPDAIDAIKGLANPLNSALAAGAERVQVVAYGGTKGDKSSDARRLSLKRALIIRQLLIDGGVPSERIDVRAMGGATDDEPADRVDIFTKA